MAVALAGGLALAPWAASRWWGSRRGTWVMRSPMIVGGALLVWAVISALGSGAPWAVSIYGWFGRSNGVLALTAALALLFAASTLRQREVQSTLRWVTGAASVAALVSIAQAFGWQAFTNPLGYGGSESVFGNPNFASGFFAITTVLALALTLSASGAAAIRIALAGATALQVVGLLLATSQQGLGAALTGLIAGGLLLGVSSAKRVVKAAAAAAAALLALGAAGLAAAGLAGVGPAAAYLRADTLPIRIEYWKATWQTMLGLPFFGTGPDGLSRYIAEFRPESYITVLGPTTRVDAAHNVALHIGATLGVVGLALWLAFAISVTSVLMWTAWTWSRRQQADHPWLLVGLGGAWIAYLTQSLVSIDTTVLIALGWTVAGLIIAMAAPGDDTRSTTGDRSVSRKAASVVERGTSVGLVVTSVGLGVLGIVVMIPGLLAERAPSIASIEDAQQALTSPLTPCPTRLTLVNSLASQVDLAAYQGLVASADATDPRCPPLKAIHADVALAAGDLATAEAASSRAVEYDPLDYEAWLLRSRVLSAVGDSAGALAAYDEAVRLADLYTGSDFDYVSQVGREIGAL